ncbi:MAG: T9SS type A sorting domain-containing protein, partial [Bacteroidota bacterium]
VVTIDIDGIKTSDDTYRVRLGGGSASMMNGTGATSTVDVDPLDITIKLNKPTQEELDTDTQADHEVLLLTYPNPTTDIVNVHFNGAREFSRVKLFSLTGQQLYDSGDILTNHHQVPVQQLSAGMYLVSIQTDAGLVNKRIEVIR